MTKSIIYLILALIIFAFLGCSSKTSLKIEQNDSSKDDVIIKYKPKNYQFILDNWYGAIVIVGSKIDIDRVTTIIVSLVKHNVSSTSINFIENNRAIVRLGYKSGQLIFLEKINNQWVVIFNGEWGS